MTEEQSLDPSEFSSPTPTTVCGNQELFDVKVQEFLKREFVPYNSHSDGDEFSLYLIQNYTNKKHILIFSPVDEEEIELDEDGYLIQESDEDVTRT